MNFVKDMAELLKGYEYVERDDTQSQYYSTFMIKKHSTDKNPAILHVYHEIGGENIKLDDKQVSGLLLFKHSYEPEFMVWKSLNNIDKLKNILDDMVK